jgi:glycosyltransferase involved in cell wall biosynthesis
VNIVHLLASPFLGGIERQVIGLAQHLSPDYQSVFLSYPERGQCGPFLTEAQRLGFEATALRYNAPHYGRAVEELTDRLRRLPADILCCHGYKPDVLGWLAGRRAGIPVVAVAHGWTAATLKVRFNELVDRLALRGMDRVVCVSEGQASKVRRWGVPARRVVVIRDSVQVDRFDEPDPAIRVRLLRLFADPPRLIVGAAGRLSPEKGFHLLVSAAERILAADRSIGFVLYGDGPLRDDLRRRIASAGLEDRFILGGFCTELDRILPHLDVVVLPSFTEGLPNILLEAGAAYVAVVATAVGGTPEAVVDGRTGYLVAPGDSDALARRISDLLNDPVERRAMGRRGRARVEEQFTFQGQAQLYERLFDELVRRPRTSCEVPSAAARAPVNVPPASRS